MRISPKYRPTAPSKSGQTPYQGTDTKRMERLRAQGKMAQRLYRGNPMHSSPWWGGYTDGYPARVGDHRTVYGINILESGEIELKSPCGGSPSDCSARNLLHRMTSNTLAVTTWGDRPVLYTSNGRKLTKRDYKPLRRYCMPHQADRDATRINPTVLIDRDLGIAAPLLPGEGGMYAYWPCEQSYPMTWSSWLVTVENEEACKIMAAALRKVCKYANAINTVMKGSKLATAERDAAHKEGDMVIAKWRTATTMLNYMTHTDDPTEIAKLIVDDHTSRQLVVLAAALSQKSIHAGQVAWTATEGYPGRPRFTTKSELWQMLREMTSNQYETKFLYTGPPKER